MELDDMKQAWQKLDQRLADQQAQHLVLYRESRLDRLRHGLYPLVWGQALQILVGVVGLLMLTPIWIAHRQDTAVLIAGLTLHLYCIGLIVVGAVVQTRIARIDYAAPVLDIQRQLAGLRRTYATWGAILVGWPWWFLSAPLLVVLSRGAIMVHAPSVIWIQLAVGAVGLLCTWWFLFRWAQRPCRAALARRIEDSITGGSLRRARAALEDVARFEQG